MGAVVLSSILAIFAVPIMGAFGETGGLQQGYGAFCIRLQCLALPVHAWVAVVNMLCAGLGKAKGAFLLATSRQGSCFIPIVHLMASLLGAYGVASVQAAADVLSLALAFPLMLAMKKKIENAKTGNLTKV